MRKSIVAACCILFVSGCASIQPTEDQQAVLDSLQSQLTTLVQENELIQQGTAAYTENKARIEEIQQQVLFYQEQINKAQQQVQAVQDKATQIQDSAQDYTQQ